MKRQLEKDGKIYIISFDDYYGDLDTVESEGKFLSLKNKVVKSILVHEDEIRRGDIPKGFNKVRR